MPILKREDGVSFVLQPYRETLTIKNSSILRKEIRYLAEQQGENVRLFKRKSGDYEAVFSRESGVLLGETVWHYFDEPEELIYCEMLNHSKDPHVLLVIIREGKVYLDAKLTPEAFSEEMVSLLVETTGRYAVYACGNLPDTFKHPAVKFFTKLEKSLFSALVVNPAFQLWSLEAALDEHGLGVQRRSSLIVVTTVCLVILGILWWYAHLEQPIQQQINPYELYNQALQTPNPGQQIRALLKGIQKLDTIRGWVADSFTYDGQGVKVPLHSLGGTTVDLMTDAQALGMSVNLSSQGAGLTFPIVIERRPKPSQIASAQQTLGLIIDRMMQVLPGKAVQVNNVTQNRVFSQTAVTITFTDVSPEVLELIASNLDDLPVALIAVTAERKDGLFSGSLQLNVVGN
jgi:hypothetical protein